jgi:hypothetical protein
MDQANEWDLIEQGKFVEACKRADEEHALTDSPLPLHNKVLALLHLERFSDAVSLCRALMTMEGADSDDEFIFCGVAYWCLNKADEAVRIWNEGTKRTYTDAAGGLAIPLLLYYAAIRMNDSALGKSARAAVKARCRTRRSNNWPGPLGLYALGELDDTELQDRVTTVPILRDRELCQANFWTGVRHSSADIERGREYMRKAISFGPSSYLEHEYYLAKGEADLASKSKSRKR